MILDFPGNYKHAKQNLSQGKRIHINFCNWLKGVNHIKCDLTPEEINSQQ